MRVETDYEPHTPIRHSTTAANYTLTSTIIGGLLALIAHAHFGVAPRWIAVIILFSSLPIFALIRFIAREARTSKTSAQLTDSSKYIADSQAADGLIPKDIRPPNTYTIVDEHTTSDNVDARSMGVGYLDSKFKWISANRCLNSHLQGAGRSLLGKSIQDTLHQRAPKLIHEIEQMLRSRKTHVKVDVVIESSEQQLIKTILSAEIHRINDSRSQDFFLLIVTHDITEYQIAIIQSNAYATLCNQDYGRDSLTETLRSTVNSIKDLFSDTSCIILSNHNLKNELTIVGHAHHKAALEKSIHTLFLAQDPCFLFTDVIRTNKAKILAPLGEVAEDPTIQGLMAAGFNSCWLAPIALSNGIIWGVVAILSPSMAMRPSPKERKHLETFLEPLIIRIEHSELLRRLERNTSRLEYAVRSAQLGVFDWNIAEGVVIWNDSMEELYGFKPKEFGRHITSWASLIPQADVGKIAAKFREIYSTGQDAFNLIHRFQHQTGEMRWSSLKGRLEYCPQGRPLRAIGVATDITEQRAIEQEAHHNHNRLQQVLEAGRLGFWDWNIQTGDVHFGGNWASMLGYSLDTISPNVESWSKLVHPEDKARIDEILSKHLRGETEYYETEHRLKKSDGSWLWVLDRGRVVERDLDGRPLRATGIHSDISEIQRARESMKSEAKKKDIFLATLAHELRNPLAPIRTGLEILQLAPKPDTVREVHKTMSRQLLLLVRLIDDLLDISRITEGKLILQKQRCSLHDIVQLGIESSQPLIDHKKHILTITQPSEPIYLHADTSRLAQVLCNLLKNAAKYTPEGGLIDLTCNTSKKDVSIVLKDSGVGIEQKHQEAVFEMFHQVPESRQHAEGGLGIGLSLAKLITELHGGTITVFSQGLNKGTTVTLKIPRDGYENHTHH